MHLKRVILMYISEVSGHRNAAIAIEKALRVLSPELEILSINAFKYTNPVAEKITNGIYMGIIKVMPRIWDYLYDNPKVVSRVEKAKKNIHKANSPKLKRLFDRFNPEAIVCTQAFPCGMVADYKKTYGLDAKLVAVLTDYAPHSYWIYDDVDFYITPSEDIGESLVRKGVDSLKVKPLGIPFDHKFNEIAERKDLLSKYKLDPSLPIVLIMGGGQGLGPIKTIVRSLERSRTELQEIVVAGTNTRLLDSLKRKIKRYKKKVLLFGYTHHINELMSLADVVISKPGGVTTAEALSLGKPMVIVKPLPGQEASNTSYLCAKGAAIKVENPRKINLVIDSLFSNHLKLEAIREVAKNTGKPNASFDIAKLILRK